MVEMTWDNNAKTRKTMIAVITAVFMMLLVLMMRRLITDQLPVAMVFGSGGAGSMALYGFTVGKRM